MTNTRMTAGDRKEEILKAAVTCAEKNGFNNLLAEDVRKLAGCSFGLVFYHYGTMTKLRRAVMRAAIREGNLAILAVGLATRDKDALKAPAALQQKALKSLAA